MKAGFIKRIYNSSPEIVKRIFSGFIRQRLIGNPVFQQQYEALVKADAMTNQEQKEMQLDLLRKSCVHAYENTVYYKRVFDEVGFDPYHFSGFEEFSDKVPVLTKQMVLDHSDEINVHSITDDYPATTGGSSGTRLQINNAWETLYRENAFDYHFESRYGYDYKKHVTLLLAGEESDGLCSTSPLYNMVRVSGRHLNEENMAQAVAFINRYKPDFVKGLPSAVYQFCKYLRIGEHRLEKPIKHVFFRSENVNPKQRKYIEETLNCACSAFYGATERVAFGEEITCVDGLSQYRFNPLYGYMEVDPSDGETIISTGFINPKMPLIRYRTDDSAKLVRDDVYMIEGHRTASLIGRNGENISVEFFCHLEDTFDKVDKYQINQYEPGKMIVDVVPRGNFTDEDKKELAVLFSKMAAGTIDPEIAVVDHVELTARGKFKLLLRAIEQ